MALPGHGKPGASHVRQSPCLRWCVAPIHGAHSAAHIGGVRPLMVGALRGSKAAARLTLYALCPGRRLVPAPLLFRAAMATPTLRRGCAGRAHSRTPDTPPLRLAPCPPGRRRTQKSNGQDERNANRKKLRWRSAIAFFCGAMLSGQPLHEKTQDKRLFVQRAQKLLFGQLCFFVWGAWVPPCLPPPGVRVLRSLRGDEGRHSRPLKDAWRPPRSFLGFLCRCGGTAFHGLRRAFRASAFVQGFPSSAATRSAECAHGAQCF